MSRILDFSGTWKPGCVLALALFIPFGALHATNLTVLYSFKGGDGDGAEPVAGLLEDSGGNLYGTTSEGGPDNDGTVFKLALDRTETVLHGFAGGDNDGSDPIAGVIADGAGNLYGTTTAGGTYNLGTVFKLATDGTETILHVFMGGDSDGSGPAAGLLADGAGNLYGTTFQGGPDNCGTVYELAPDGAETLLHAFSGGDSDGTGPAGGLIADRNGNFFGTTAQGGGDRCLNRAGCGTVFKLAPNGAETLLYAFRGKRDDDGSVPLAGLIAGKQGYLYGTTVCGSGPGCGMGCGTVFQFGPYGAETVLHSFTGGNDGAAPEGGLIAGGSGNLYGTAHFGGVHDRGNVFELTRHGSLRVLHSVTGGTDGGGPDAGLIADKAGKLYGTASSGGADGYGTVFKLAE